MTRRWKGTRMKTRCPKSDPHGSFRRRTVMTTRRCTRGRTPPRPTKPPPIRRATQQTTQWPPLPTWCFRLVPCSFWSGPATASRDEGCWCCWCCWCGRFLILHLLLRGFFPRPKRACAAPNSSVSFLAGPSNRRRSCTLRNRLWLLWLLWQE